MIEQMQDLPEQVLGFKASGTVTAQDYEEVIIPAVEAFFSCNDKAHFLYQLGEDFKGFEAGALLDDVKLGLRHISGWEKLAIVTDVEWLRDAVIFMRLMIPGELRLFSNDELEQARQWVID